MPHKAQLVTCLYFLTVTFVGMQGEFGKREPYNDDISEKVLASY